MTQWSALIGGFGISAQDKPGDDAQNGDERQDEQDTAFVAHGGMVADRVEKGKARSRTAAKKNNAANSRSQLRRI